MSRTLMNILIDSNDPRTGVYAQPVEDSTVYPNGYGGMPNGLLQDSSSQWFSYASRPGLAFYPGETAYGTFGTPAGLSTPSYLMTCAEVMFIEAAAAERGLGGLSSTQAKEFYETAITASLEQWGIREASVNAEDLQAAIARQGPDNFGTRVYRDTRPKAAPTCTAP